MNIAFYINELNNSEDNLEIYDFLNRAVSSGLFEDVSLFVNNINFMDKPVKFGIFNSTELWNYTGILINTSLQNTDFTSKVVNKFKNCYFFKEKNKENIFRLIDIVKTTPCFASNEHDHKELFRITGKSFPMIALTPEELHSKIEVLYGNERSN